MDIKESLIVFDALSQETRLRAFRLLVQAGPDGMPAGALSDALDVPHNTLSFHLGHLSNAGIVSSRKEGRSVIYAARFDTMRNLIGFLVRDCCSAPFAQIREDRQSGCSVIELADGC
ncbi:ArsR/SmtB family transcription factor [Elongatibacter sediminis]|uniref:Metalloregulator ArsR/SmtB family transcription factor n=1 Tax=Elongatibacter sediminis TaxID=3119006 RepID=A0AAW9RJR0_9GAMM